MMIPQPSQRPEVNWFMGMLSSFRAGDKERTYTVQELRRHNHANSAWILVGDAIYDATSYVRGHPGGMAAILKKSGGAADCSEDLRFHSRRAQRTWKKFKVGTLIHYPYVTGEEHKPEQRDDESSAEGSGCEN